MILALAILAAFPLGYLMQNRTTACLAFGLAFAHLFTFQTAQLVLEATRGSKDAFGDLNDPDWNWFGDTIGYLAISTLIYVIGLTLVVGGHAVAKRRASRKEAGIRA